MKVDDKIKLTKQSNLGKTETKVYIYLLCNVLTLLRKELILDACSPEIQESDTGNTISYLNKNVSLFSP